MQGFGSAARRGRAGVYGFAAVLLFGSAGAALAGPAAAVRDAIPCRLVLEARDAAARTLFRTVAAAGPRPGLVAAPLDLLERGGVRWETLWAGRTEAGGGDPLPVASVAALDAESNLAWLDVPGFDGCPGEAAAPAPTPVPGTAIRVARERSAFRDDSIGGRVDRAIPLAGDRTLVLIHLLDDQGSDPGLAFDSAGRFLGGVTPPPAGADRALAAVVLASGPPAGGPVAPVGGAGTGPDAPRARLLPRAEPSAGATAAGLVAQSLLLTADAEAERAADLLDRAMRTEGPTAPLLLERGILRFRAGRLPGAIADFETAAAGDPASYLARYNLGIALGSAGRYDAAAEALQAARDLNPQHPRTHFDLALALLASQRPGDARHEYDSLVRLDPTLAADLRPLLGF